MRILKYVAFSALLSSGIAAYAECPESLPVPERISCLKMENELFKELIKYNDLREQANQEDDVILPTKPNEVPKVLAIYGVDGKISATLLYHESKGKLSVKPGDALPDGSKVLSIDENRVVLSNRGKKIVLLINGPEEKSPPKITSSPQSPNQGASNTPVSQILDVKR